MTSLAVEIFVVTEGQFTGEYGSWDWHPQDDGALAWRVGGSIGNWYLPIKFATKRDAERALRGLNAAGINPENVDDVGEEETYRVMVEALAW